MLCRDVSWSIFYEVSCLCIMLLKKLKVFYYFLKLIKSNNKKNVLLLRINVAFSLLLTLSMLNYLIKCFHHMTETLIAINLLSNWAEIRNSFICYDCFVFFRLQILIPNAVAILFTMVKYSKNKSLPPITSALFGRFFWRKTIPWSVINWCVFWERQSQRYCA